MSEALLYLKKHKFGPLTKAALRRSNDQPTRSYVYFISDETAKQIKIGVATKPRSRLSTMQSGSTNKLTLLGVLAGGRALERELHEEFAADRQRGEWFTATERLCDLVRAAFEAGTGLPWGSNPDDSRPRGTWLFEDHEDTRPYTKLGAAEIREFADLMGIDVQEARRLESTLPLEQPA